MHLLMQGARLADFEDKWIAPHEHHFVQLGDLVDRGSNSAEVINFAMKLKKEHPDQVE